MKPVTMNAASLVTLLYAAAIPLCLWLLVRYPFEMDRLPLYFLAPLLPFFLAGMALSIIFDLHRTESSSLYFYDLVGCGARSGPGDASCCTCSAGKRRCWLAQSAPAVAAVADRVCLRVTGERRKLRLQPHESFEAWRSITVLLTAGAAFSAVKFGAFRVKPGTTKAMRNQMDASPGSKIVADGMECLFAHRLCGRIAE